MRGVQLRTDGNIRARPPGPLRVLVVDDDPVYRNIVSRTLSRLAQVEVVAGVGTIAQAQARLAQGGIDLVSLDVVLRDESGLDLLRWIRQHHPGVPTVLVTGGSGTGVTTSVDALLIGAAALVLKPSGASAAQELSTALERVVDAVRSSLVTSTVAPPRERIEVPPPRTAHFAMRRELVAVGASTGGPPVLVEFLKRLPPAFSVPVVITQHMPSLHVPYFAELLAKQSGRRVVLARHSDPVEPSTVYLACGGLHLTVARRANLLVLQQDQGPEEHNCRPAVDPLFRSVAAACGSASVAVLMTGMGTDGAAGAVVLRAKGAPVVVQDQATSVVWGMPGAAVAAGGADAVAPGPELANWVVKWTSGHKQHGKG